MALKIAGYASMAVFAFAAVSCGTKKSVVPEHTTETVRPAEVAKKATANIFDGVNAERRINIEAGGGGNKPDIGSVTLHLPAFRAMAVCNQHLDHGPLSIELDGSVILELADRLISDPGVHIEIGG